MSANFAWAIVPLVVGLSQPAVLAMSVEYARRTGVMESAIALHVVGSVVGVGWLAAGLRGEAGFAGMAAVPWWAWLGGAIGVTCMAAMNRATPELGVAAALAIAVASQLTGGLVVEQLGWLGSEVRAATPDRWLGAALLALGAWLVAR